MSRGAGAALVVASAVYAILIVAAARHVGAYYEEVVPYVLTPLDVRSPDAGGTGTGSAPWFVTSPWLPRLAFAPTADTRLPLLNQLYMTDHLSYGGVVLAQAGIDPLWAARLWHAAFGLILLWLLYDVTRLLGFGTRTALVGVAVAATSLQITTCYTPARFDESLASFGTVAVLWAALRYSRNRRRLWIWVGVTAIAVAVTGKLTALWPLAGLAAAGALAGWRPPPLRALARPALVAVPLFAPIVGFALAGSAASGEVGRRLQFLTDLFTSDAIPATAANLIDYLGSWSSMTSVMVRGADAQAPNVLGRLLVCATLIWILVRGLGPRNVPRRYRRETQMLAFLAVVFTFVLLFFRERHDYQFVLLIPLNALALAAFLDWCARRFLDGWLPAWLVAAVICGLPVASNLWEQRTLHEDLVGARNAMVDLGTQRASAAWLAAHGVHHPIVESFYAVGTYELLSNGAVRPIYAYPLLRHAKDSSEVPDPLAVWRALLADGGTEPRFVLLPLGQNPIEAQHFDELAIRAALFEVAEGQRVAVFGNRQGEPLLEVWQVTPRPPTTGLTRTTSHRISRTTPDDTAG